jgi:hypothetical protein
MTRPGDRQEPSGPPLLRVVRGDASPEEIAALVAVLMARAGDAGAPGQDRSGSRSWSDRSRQLRRPLFPGPGAWRRSGLP